MMTISVPIQKEKKMPFNEKKPSVLKWKKLNPSDIAQYTDRLGVMVDQMSEVRGDSSSLFCQNDCHCSNERCKYFI